MIARYTGACLGLLAFTITSAAGLVTGNTVSVTLSRSLFALLAFCAFGMLLGQAAQLVVREYEQNRESEIRRRIQTTAGSAASVTIPGAEGTASGRSAESRSDELGGGAGAEPPVVTVGRAPSPTG